MILGLFLKSGSVRSTWSRAVILLSSLAAEERRGLVIFASWIVSGWSRRRSVVAVNDLIGSKRGKLWGIFYKSKWYWQNKCLVADDA